MKKILLIEIKDTYANITLINNVNAKWHLIFHKKYYFNNKNFLSHEKNMYDFNWISFMKKDIQEIMNLSQISNIYLVINTFGTLIKTQSEIFNFEIDNDKIKKIIKDKVLLNIQNKFSLLGMTINSIKEKTSHFKKEISYTYEIVEKNFLSSLKSNLYLEGFDNLKIISSYKANYNSIKKYANDYITYNICIEERFTIVNILNNGKIKNILKYEHGLDFIYKNIQKNMKINILESKKLFKNIGNIPPSAIKDNKVIYTRFLENNEQMIYSKKDLSRYITESVNTIFSNFINNFELREKSKLLFSGEIAILKGFENYAITSFDIKDVDFFKSSILGLDSSTNFTSLGVLNIINNDINKNVKEKIYNDHLNTIEQNYSRKKISHFKEKIIKYFNYI